jgi:hypothetical protein
LHTIAGVKGENKMEGKVRIWGKDLQIGYGQTEGNENGE